jgi:hypothetical protein
MSSARHKWIAGRVGQTFDLDEARVAGDLFAGEDGARFDTFLKGNNDQTKLFVHFQPRGSVTSSAKDLSKVNGCSSFDDNHRLPHF